MKKRLRGGEREENEEGKRETAVKGKKEKEPGENEQESETELRVCCVMCAFSSINSF